MQVQLFSNIAALKTILYLVQKSKTNEMKRTDLTSIFVAIVAIMVSSCSREDRFSVPYTSQETHTIFNISVAKNTKTKSSTKSSTTKSDVSTKAYSDSKTSFDAEKKHAFIDSEIAFGLVGVDVESRDVLVDAQPVHEINGVRSTNVVTTDLSSGTLKVSAFYPHVNSVNYRKDGSYSVSFTPNDIKKGPLASEAVEMRCDQDHETVNLKFHHITNSFGFKVCDITDDDQLQGLMRIRKVVLHGMPTEGLYVCDGDDSYWVPNAKRQELVFFEGDDCVACGEENAGFIGMESLSDNNEECNRMYVVPEELTDKHYVEVYFDVNSFDYDGTHYGALCGMSQVIPLSGVVPDDVLEKGLQYTFILGLNLESVYRTIEFTASVDDWEGKFDCRILDYDNE